MHDIPRRCDILRHTPGEAAIYAAVQAVESVGAHPLLSDAVALLTQAQRKVADYIDRPDESHIVRAVITPGEGFRSDFVRMTAGE